MKICIVCKKAKISRSNQKVCPSCREGYYLEQSRIRENKRYWKNHNVEKERRKESYHKNCGRRRKERREKLLQKCPFKYCHICGVRFNVDTLTKLKSQRYCSKVCYLKAKNTFIHKNQINKLKTKKCCVTCGKRLFEKDYGSQYKCLKCNLKSVNAGRVRMDVKEHRFEKINCTLCGEDITNRHSVSKYCNWCAKEILRLCGMKSINTNHAISLINNKIGRRRGKEVEGICEEFLWKVEDEDLFRIYENFYKKLKREPLLKEIEKKEKDFSFGYQVRIRFGGWDKFKKVNKSRHSPSTFPKETKQ